MPILGTEESVALLRARKPAAANALSAVMQTISCRTSTCSAARPARVLRIENSDLKNLLARKKNMGSFIEAGRALGIESFYSVKRQHQIDGFILAGGSSSRMRQHKALLEFAGVPLIVETARLLEPLVRKVTVVGSPERYVPLGLDAISDQIYGRDESGHGPLVGIASALAAAQTPWNLILACDLPYLSTDWVEWLLARALQSDAQVAMPQSGRGIEPLAAVYRRECARAIEASLQRGVRKVSDALSDLRVELISSSEWRQFDPDGRVLTNMNTPTDYAEARKWWETKNTKCRGPDRGTTSPQRGM